MKFKGFLISIALLAAGTANASTVLTATDGDVNFLFNPLPAGVTLYMFDDDFNNDFASATDNLLVPIPSIVGIFGPTAGSNYIATNSLADTLTLTDAPNFVMAVWDNNLYGLNNGGWVGDSSPVWYGGGNSVHLTFNTSGGVYVVDVVPAVIPVPAAVWLFGSGLLGLVGIARRRHS